MENHVVIMDYCRRFARCVETTRVTASWDIPDLHWVGSGHGMLLQHGDAAPPRRVLGWRWQGN